jgi:hypothetical protein
MPFEQPAHFEMAINTRVAAAIGIELPFAHVARADEVIEYQGDVAYWGTPTTCRMPGQFHDGRFRPCTGHEEKMRNAVMARSPVVGRVAG